MKMALKCVYVLVVFELNGLTGGLGFHIIIMIHKSRKCYEKVGTRGCHTRDTYRNYFDLGFAFQILERENNLEPYSA